MASLNVLPFVSTLVPAHIGGRTTLGQQGECKIHAKCEQSQYNTLIHN